MPDATCLLQPLTTAAMERTKRRGKVPRVVWLGRGRVAWEGWVSFTNSPSAVRRLHHVPHSCSGALELVVFRQSSAYTERNKRAPGLVVNGQYGWHRRAWLWRDEVVLMLVYRSELEAASELNGVWSKRDRLARCL